MPKKHARKLIRTVDAVIAAKLLALGMATVASTIPREKADPKANEKKHSVLRMLSGVMAIQGYRGKIEGMNRDSIDPVNPKIDPKALPKIQEQLTELGFRDSPAIAGKSTVVMFRILSCVRAAGLTELEARCALNASLAVLPDVFQQRTKFPIEHHQEPLEFEFSEKALPVLAKFIERADHLGLSFETAMGQALYRWTQAKQGSVPVCVRAQEPVPPIPPA